MHSTSKVLVLLTPPGLFAELMSSARDSFASRLQGPYAGRVQEASIGYTVTPFDELPFAEAGDHKVVGPADLRRPLTFTEFKKLLACLGWTDKEFVEAYYRNNSTVSPADLALRCGLLCMGTPETAMTRPTHWSLTRHCGQRCHHQSHLQIYPGYLVVLPVETVA